MKNPETRRDSLNFPRHEDSCASKKRPRQVAVSMSRWQTLSWRYNVWDNEILVRHVTVTLSWSCWYTFAESPQLMRDRQHRARKVQLLRECHVSIWSDTVLPAKWNVVSWLNHSRRRKRQEEGQGHWLPRRQCGGRISRQPFHFVSIKEAGFAFHIQGRTVKQSEIGCIEGCAEVQCLR